MKYWILADPHFYHEMMIAGKFRPDNYADKIFRGLQQIPEGDVLICLGDITVGNDEEVHAKFIEPLKCRKWLVK